MSSCEYIQDYRSLLLVGEPGFHAWFQEIEHDRWTVNQSHHNVLLSHVQGRINRVVNHSDYLFGYSYR